MDSLFPAVGLTGGGSGSGSDSSRATASASSNLAGGGQSVNISSGGVSAAWIVGAAALVAVVYLIRR